MKLNLLLLYLFSLDKQQHKENIKLIVVNNENGIPLLNYKEEVFKEGKEEILNIRKNMKKNMKKNKKMNNGDDYRKKDVVKEIEEIEEIREIAKIKENRIKQRVYNILKDENVGIFEKVNLIDDYNLNYVFESKLVPNIKKNLDLDEFL